MSACVLAQNNALVLHLQNPVNNHSQQMVQGLLGLLRLCPQEVAHLRKELLIAARHILSTELRNSVYYYSLYFTSGFVSLCNTFECIFPVFCCFVM
jgi:transformation/transcription domain-associated protein